MNKKLINKASGAKQIIRHKKLATLKTEPIKTVFFKKLNNYYQLYTISEYLLLLTEGFFL